jgi:hypothetical protein
MPGGPHPVLVADPPASGVLGGEPNGPPRPPRREDDSGPVEAVPLPLVLEAPHEPPEAELTHDYIITMVVALYNSI